MTKSTSSGVVAYCSRGGSVETIHSRGGPLAVRGWLWMSGFATLVVLAAASQPAGARDRGQYASTSPELKAWFDSLRSGRGPCCSDADGAAVSDVDWESKDGRYRVRIEGEWVTVPDDAVITTPNRVGRTMVWPIYLEGRPVVRCFMPGSMT